LQECARHKEQELQRRQAITNAGRTDREIPVVDIDSDVSSSDSEVEVVSSNIVRRDR
jgi:hypothetical protein